MTVRTDVIAQHYLVGGAPESERHSHHYVVELQLDGSALHEHGYLVDIVRVEAELRNVRAYYADRLLNDHFGARSPAGHPGDQWRSRRPGAAGSPAAVGLQWGAPATPKVNLQ